MMATIVITGAAGVIGTAVTPLLADRHELRLVDIDVPDDADGSWTQCSVTDSEKLGAVMEGADAVVHLAGIASEAPWDDLLQVNIDGTKRVLEAARDAGVRRVLLASSIHAGGYSTGSTADVHAVRPDSYYGVSKVAMEALGSLFADRFEMCIVSARICTFGHEPSLGRTVATWLSVNDTVRLIEAAVRLEAPGNHVVWGVSANSPGWFPLEPGRQIGYHPADNATQLLTETHGALPQFPDPRSRLGGPLLDVPLGGRPDSDPRTSHR